MKLTYVNNVVATMNSLLGSEKQFHAEVFIDSDDAATNNNFVGVEKRLVQILEMDDYRLPLGFLYFLLMLLGRNTINPRCDYNLGKLLAMGFMRPVDFDVGLTKYASWYRSVYFSSRRSAS